MKDELITHWITFYRSAEDTTGYEIELVEKKYLYATRQFAQEQYNRAKKAEKRIAELESIGEEARLQFEIFLQTGHDGYDQIKKIRDLLDRI